MAQEVSTDPWQSNLDGFLGELGELLVRRFGSSNGHFVPSDEGEGVKRVQEAVQEVAESDAEEIPDFSNKRKWNIRALRKLAVERGFEEDDVADAERDDLVKAIIEDMRGGAEDEEDEEPEEEPAPAKKSSRKAASKKAEPEPDEDDEDEDDDEEDEGYTEEQLRALSLAKLRKVAVEEFEVDPDDVKGKDKDAIIAMLSGDEDDDEDDDDDEAEDDEDEEADDEDEEDDDEDDEEEAITEEDLRAMNLRELKAVAKELEITVPKGISQSDLVDLILEEAA